MSYVGHPVAELAEREPEEVVFLLLHRQLPSDGELTAFKADLRARQGVPRAVLSGLRSLPREGHPMLWLVNGLTLLAMTGTSGDWEEDARNMVAWAPELVAAIFRIRSGWGEPIAPRHDLGLIENFVHMLGVPGDDSEGLIQLMRIFYILHLDHGGGNLSTFTGKTVASSHADLFSSLAAAMCGLYGPLHGRANQD